ncbi:CopY/TcrY family copper transport repressor [Streptococcus mutans]|uniref:CopY/TcrY family copper transport repressor n=1 Tax=Streptococcus mutans TaxID=1309 RepID=UPI0002B4FEDA|nr:COPAB ATPases metal-fist type repressor [Streptococcus mutans 24]NLQ35718.1 CopY/TcrY family copper transport repressor [Streptococcus mutans]OVF01955.1 uracil phosphoribosyltransferase [Streptococcus mutans]
MISEAEWQVIKILWMRPESTSTELIQILRKKFSWSPSTVKTLLRRLIDKGAIRREKHRKVFEYSAVLTQDESTELVVQSVQQHLCAKKIPLVIAKLIQASDLTTADIENISTLLSNKQTVENIICNCMD